MGHACVLVEADSALVYAHFAGTLAEAKQLSALQSLLSLTSGPEAGFLGSSWVIILRAISALDALKVRETARLQPSFDMLCCTMLFSAVDLGGLVIRLTSSACRWPATGCRPAAAV
jgi:hypothetical protein